MKLKGRKKDSDIEGPMRKRSRKNSTNSNNNKQKGNHSLNKNIEQSEKNTSNKFNNKLNNKSKKRSQQNEKFSPLICSQPQESQSTTNTNTKEAPKSSFTQINPEPNPLHLNQLNQSIQQLVSQVVIPQISCTTTPIISQTQTEPSSSRVIKKLGELTPNATLASSRATRFRAGGHRQAAIPSSRLKPTCKIPNLTLAISRKSNFSFLLKKSLLHFNKFKTCKIVLLAMGCAVSMCFSLAMAIESNLHIGPSCRLVKSISTGTVVVGDEITLKDQETDHIYQTRNQASIEIQLSIEFIPDQLKSITSLLFS